MAEYTYKDIIIDPISEEAKNAIGEGCYFGSNPKTVLDFANCNEKKFLRVLECIKPEEDNPFYDYNYGFPCIIVKKEEPKPKYVPFESAEEFISAYSKARKESMPGTESMLSGFGMWLKCGEHYESVTYIHNNGIAVDDISIIWKTLFDSYTFLDGSLCGKLVEESNA